jgi:hypothetical protein
MASVAYVKDPEHDDSTLDHLWRYSTSLYFRHAFRPDWSFDNTLIIGVIRGADHIDSLTSIGEEFLFTFGRPKLWGRVEILQRTASQLNIASAVQPTHPEWVSALTFGYTHSVWRWSVAELAVGASATADILPAVFADTYGGSTLWTGKIFLQTTAMRMWAL